jgi:hypothetical protein
VSVKVQEVWRALMKSARRKPKEYSIFDLHPVTLKRRSPQSLGAVIDRKGKKRTSERKKAEVKAGRPPPERPECRR